MAKPTFEELVAQQQGPCVVRVTADEERGGFIFAINGDKIAEMQKRHKSSAGPVLATIISSLVEVFTENLVAGIKPEEKIEFAAQVFLHASIALHNKWSPKVGA